MKGLKKYSTGLLFPFLIAVTLIPNVQADPAYPKESVIFYSNGMLTIERVAQYNRTALERHLKQNILNQLSNFSSDELTFELAYNHSFGQNIEGGIDDLHEAIAEQLSENSISVFWRSINLLQNSGNPISAAMAVILRNLLADLVLEYEGTSTLDQQPEMQQHADKYNQMLKECKRLILLGHSQGAIISNIAHTGIEPTLQSAIAVMGVGTPDSYVAGEGNFYTNLEEDLLVQSIPGALPGNVDNYDDLTAVPGSGHALIGNYIDFYSLLPSEEKIVDDLVAMIEQIQSFENIEYCGWPAVFGEDISIIFQPYDIEQTEISEYSLIWDYVWEAALSNTLIIQFRLAGANEWQSLARRRSTILEDAEYALFGELPEFPDYVVDPFIFVNNKARFYDGYDKSIRIYLDYYHPPGIYEYRFIVENKVIDQIKLLQNHDGSGYWSEILTGNPISYPLPVGSIEILPLP